MSAAPISVAASAFVRSPKDAIAPSSYEDVKTSTGMKLRIVPLRAWMWVKDLKEGDQVNLRYAMSHGHGDLTCSVCVVSKEVLEDIGAGCLEVKTVTILEHELAYTIAEEKSLRAHDEKEGLYRIEKILGSVHRAQEQDNMKLFHSDQAHVMLELTML